MSAGTRSKARTATSKSTVNDMPNKQGPAPAMASGNGQTRIEDEIIDEDDLCPICRLLLCNPVTTRCNHTLCSSCMAQWAEVSISMPNLAIVSIDEEPQNFDAATGLEAKCPM